MPRSSRGCRNCVGRKIKCDETVPICNNCQRANLECGGRQDMIIIINQGRRRPNGSPAARHTSDVRRRSSTALSDHSPARSTNSPPSPGRTISNAKDKHISHLLSNFRFDLFRTHPGKAEIHWLLICLEHPDRYPTANAALDCFAAAVYGKQNRDGYSLSMARKMYGDALAGLHNAIQDGPTQVGFDVLAATGVLHRYENMMYTSHSGWVHHAGGVARLIQLCGPKTFKEFPMRAILNANWYTAIMDAYLSRRPTFLADGEWRNLEVRLPHCPEEFSEIQHFWARFTSLVGRVQAIHDQGLPWGPELPKLISAFRELRGDLESWYAEWNAVPGITQELPVDTDFYSDEEGPIFSSMIQHSSIGITMGYNLYNTLMMLVICWLYRLTHPGWQKGKQRDKVKDIPEAYQLSLDICRSLHHHFVLDDDENIIRATFLLVFCAGFAFKFLPAGTRESKWLSNLLGMLADKHGIEIVRRMRDFHIDEWRIAMGRQAVLSL